MPAPSTRKRGSKQFWPRKRANKPTAKVNSWKSKTAPKETNLLGFPGYKVAMTNIGVIDNFSHTMTKGTQINVPVTVVECPPVKIQSVRLLADDEYGNLQVAKEVSTQLKDKHLNRKLDVQKKKQNSVDSEKLIEEAKELAIEEVRVKVVTTPSQTSIGKKKPEVLELGVGGNSIEEQIRYAVDLLGKQVNVSDVFNAGELTDSHSVTKGYGFQGAVKRFGVKLTSIKSEKKRRHAGNVGAWTPARVPHTVPLPGQTGYHLRTELNKWILKISNNPEEINKSSGFKHYGNVQNEFLLIKGSLQGPVKRLVTLTRASRPNPRYPKVAPEITYINR